MVYKPGEDVWNKMGLLHLDVPNSLIARTLAFIFFPGFKFVNTYFWLWYIEDPEVPGTVTFVQSSALASA